MGLCELKRWRHTSVPTRGGSNRRVQLRAYGIHCYAGVAAGYHVDGAVELPEWIDCDYQIEGTPWRDDEGLFGQMWNESAVDRAGLAEYASRRKRSRPTTHWHGPSWRRARTLLDSHWDDVEAVTDALLKRGTVRSNTVEKILRETTRSRSEMCIDLQGW